MKKKILWFAIPVILIAGAALWGPIMSNVEQAKYSVAVSEDAIEIRDYAPRIIAQTEVSGERKEAINQGFRVVADYIFGNNTSSQKIAMTTPVMQQKGETIAMTAPVLQSGDDTLWKVEFVMPDSYTLETLPKPNSDLVQLIKVPEKRFAAIRFTGFASQRTLNKQTDNLKAYIRERDLKAISAPIYAFYNPPWTLPFLRRNEVMIELSTEQAQ